MYHCTKVEVKFSIIDFFSKCDQILNGKLYLLCSVLYFCVAFSYKSLNSVRVKYSIETTLFPGLVIHTVVSIQTGC